MKKLAYIAFAAAALWAGCTEDHGNYDYSQINSIAIGGLEEQYNVDRFDRLNITPELQFAEGENLNLGFEWVVNGHVISTDRVCDAEITEAANGTTSDNISPYDSYLCVTDLDNNLKYYRDFTVKVTNAYSISLYMLSELADGTASLSMQRRDKPDAPVVTDVFEKANPDFGSLGKYPQALVYHPSPANYATKYMQVVCKEGDKKIASLLPATMSYEMCYNENAVLGGFSGQFAPTFMHTSDMGGVVTANGNAFLFDYWGNTTISPLLVSPNYNIVWGDINNMTPTAGIAVYDEKAYNFMELSSSVSSTTTFSVKKMINAAPLTGQKYLASAPPTMSPNTAYGMDAHHRVILHDGTTAYLYDINLSLELSFVTWDMEMKTSCTLKGTVPGSVINANTVCAMGYSGTYWFLGNGPKVQRLFYDGGTPVDWYTVPKGNVTAMLFDLSNKRVFVASWDGTKSYVYVLDAQTPQTLLESTPLEVPGKIVSMARTGIWKY